MSYKEYEWVMVTGHLVINLDFNKTKYPRSKSTTVIMVQVSSILTITTMIDNIMNNTYGVLTNRVSVEDILEMYTGEDAMFYGDPFKTTTEDIDEVIGYFENTEEYEKCMELLYIKNDIIADGLTKKLIKDVL